ncbi:hypothetical protein CCR75_001045 [Bremia lactucae]|uniref:Uncharacterized protein n=1 Tax=Bremia lactucae TaxID=4779 RepID=A0A976FRD0_BRELC|nr:hypothetical protein CCR75_001045 [Bremia lactucae]
MPSGASVERPYRTLSKPAVVHCKTKRTISEVASIEAISTDNQDINNGTDNSTSTFREGYRSSAISNQISEEGHAVNAQDTHYVSAVTLRDQIEQPFIGGINPYVEHHREDDDDLSIDDSSSSSEEESNVHALTMKESNHFIEWENPSYLVKDLDTGESYRVEEIDQQFTLVTLDSVAAQHKLK